MDAKSVLKVFKVLESNSKKNPEGFEFFHMWDADAQGDMCVRIVKRMNARRLAFNGGNIVNQFSVIVYYSTLDL